MTSDYPFQLLRDKKDITSKYLDCKNDTCTLQFVRFLFQDSFKILRTDSPLGEINKLRLYQVFFSSENNDIGSFLLDIPDKNVSVRIEQSSFNGKIIKIRVFELRAILSVFNYADAAFNCEEGMVFVDSEIKNLDNDCLMSLGGDFVQSFYGKMGNWTCSGDSAAAPDNHTRGFYELYNEVLDFNGFPRKEDKVIF